MSVPLSQHIQKLEEAEGLLFTLRSLLEAEFPDMLDNEPVQIASRLSMLVSTRLDSLYAAKARNERTGR